MSDTLGLYRLELNPGSALLEETTPYDPQCCQVKTEMLQPSDLAAMKINL